MTRIERLEITCMNQEIVLNNELCDDLQEFNPKVSLQLIDLKLLNYGNGSHFLDQIVMGREVLDDD